MTHARGMLFFSGPGFSGFKAAQDLCSLPKSARAGCAGMSGGALAALAVALGDSDAVLRALDEAAWPGRASRLRRSLDRHCTLGLTFGTWHLREDEAEVVCPFCVLAWSTTRHAPVLFSLSSTPDLPVSVAVACACAWPGAAPGHAELDGFCDAEFYVCPLDVFTSLRPPRAVAVVGSQPSLRSWAGRLADYHGAFMAALERRHCCVGLVLSVPGPHVADSILCRESARRSVLGTSMPVRTLLALGLVVSVLLAVCIGEKDPAAGHSAPAAPVVALSRRARKRKERRRIRRVRQAMSRCEGRIEGSVGNELPIAGVSSSPHHVQSHL